MVGPQPLGLCNGRTRCQAGGSGFAREVWSGSHWRVAQFDTLRLRLIKLAVRIEVLKTKVRLHLPRATPDQALFTLLLTCMPRLSI
jgi:hypothetical protein